MPYFPFSCLSFTSVPNHPSLLLLLLIISYEDSQIVSFLGRKFSSVPNSIKTCSISITLMLESKLWMSIERFYPYLCLSLTGFGGIHLFFLFFLPTSPSFFLHSLSLLLKLHCYGKFCLWKDVVCIRSWSMLNFPSRARNLIQERNPFEHLNEHGFHTL